MSMKIKWVEGYVARVCEKIIAERVKRQLDPLKDQLSHEREIVRGLRRRVKNIEDFLQEATDPWWNRATENHSNA
jgi:hypothetical protein